GDQADLGAAAGQNGVGGHAGAVHHTADLRRIDGGDAADPLDAVEYRNGRVVGGGRDLGGEAFARLIINQQQVGEGTAHVYAQTKTHVCSPSASRFRGPGRQSGRPCVTRISVRLSPVRAG